MDERNQQKWKKVCGIGLAAGDTQELVLFFNSGLPMLTSCPLSAGALSTSRLPSIPGLFLCTTTPRVRLSDRV